MLFLISILLIVLSEIIFVRSLILDSNSFFHLIGFIHLLTLISFFILLFFSFRNRNKKSDFLKGLTLFGILIICGIPTLANLIPGTIYILTDNEQFKWLGWFLTVLLLIGFIVGVIHGRWNWKIHRVELTFPHLPADFHEIKLVQISDIHVGSFFNNHEKVKKAIQKINALKADYIFFYW